MGESSLHAFLKKIGKAFLLNQGCFLVDTEVALSRTESIHELDNHRVVDVLGVVKGFSRREKRQLIIILDFKLKDLRLGRIS